jgi:hypothetical protein
LILVLIINTAHPANGNYKISYTGTQPFGGTWITIGASTGGAWAEHYVRYICVEYI